MKKTEEKKDVEVAQDDMLPGIEAIEFFMKKPYIELIPMRRDYPDHPFPMKKRGGVWTLSKSEFHAWCAGLNLDPEHPEKITIEAIEQTAERRRLEAFPDRELSSLEEILSFTNHRADTIIDWMKSYSACPIRRGEGKDGYKNASVRTRELVLWTHENHLPLHPRSTTGGRAAPWRY